MFSSPAPAIPSPFRSASMLRLCIVVVVAVVASAVVAFVQPPHDANAPNVERCTFRDNRTSGVCRPLPDCPQAFAELQSQLKRRPTLCGFADKTPSVCCLASTSERLAADGEPVRPSVRACQNFRLSTNGNDHFDVNRLKINVVGGQKTAPAEFPHMAALGWTSAAASSNNATTISWKCGGTLISDRYVLTAAHCVKRTPRPDVVRLGQHDLRSRTVAQSADHRVASIVRHPDYQQQRAYNDIALIRLAEPVRFGVRLRPACLWLDASEQGTPLRMLATGFGLTEFGGSPSADLLKVQLNTVPLADCKRSYPNSRQLPDGLLASQLCAGDATGARDTCQGDSGGPLQLRQQQQQPYVVGVTSFGRGCATGTPGVYTRVGAFVDWIESVVWQ